MQKIPFSTHIQYLNKSNLFNNNKPVTNEAPQDGGVWLEAWRRRWWSRTLDETAAMNGGWGRDGAEATH